MLTKKRILIGLVCLLTLGLVAGAGLGLIWHQRKTVYYESERAKAYEALDEQAYEQALRHFSQWLRWEPDDTEALMDFADARLKVVHPTGDHILGAASAYRKVVRLEPENVEALKELAVLQSQMQQKDEALETVEKLTQLAPDDMDTHMRYAMVLAADDQNERALKAVDKAIKIDPTSMRARLMRVELMNRLKLPVDEITEYVDTLVSEHPDNLEFALVRAVAYARVSEHEKAIELIQDLVKEDPPSVRYASLLDGLCQRYRLFGEALTMLQRANEVRDDGEVRDLLAWRMFQAEQHDKVAQTVNQWREQDKAVPARSYAIAAVSAFVTGRREQAEQRLEQLSQMGPSKAKLWAPLLRVMFDPKMSQAKSEAFEQARSALARDPGNPLLQHLMGLAYREVGEYDLALSSLEGAAKSTRAWARPWTEAAQIQMMLGRYNEAGQSAAKALSRMPGYLPAARIFARAHLARFTLGQEPSQEQQQALNRLIDRILERQPDDANMLALKATLRYVQGKPEEAREIITSLMEGDSVTVGQRHLVTLAEVAKRVGDMSLHNQLYKLFEQDFGLTPQLAFSRALQLAQDGQKQEALELFDQGMQANPGDARDWDLARTRFLERIGDESATQAWVDLSQNYPEDIRIQRLALASSSTADRREFREQATARLKELTGSHGLTWKVAQAQALLSDSEDPDNAARAAALLEEVVRAGPSYVEARLLLAVAYERLKSSEQAIEQVERALESRPWSAQLVVRLAELLAREGRGGAAVETLRRLDQIREVDPRFLRAGARLLNNQAVYGRAVELLERAHGPDVRSHPPADPLLADVYWRSGRPELARGVAEKLLKAENLTVGTIGDVADMFERLGEPEKAAEMLARLEESELDDTQRMLLAANHWFRQGDTAQALELLTQAVQQDPEHRDAWRMLVEARLRQGDLDGASNAASQALKHLSEDRIFLRLTELSDLLHRVHEDRAAKLLAPALMGDKQMVEATVEALRTIDQGKQSDMSFGQNLRLLAESHPEHLTLQLATAEVSWREGDRSQAMAVARDAYLQFPKPPVAAEFLTRLQMMNELWTEAESTARGWRGRLGTQTLPADLALAEIQINLAKFHEAAELLEPHVTPAFPTQGPGWDVTRRYVQALIGSGQTEQAGNLLMPRIDEDRVFQLWLFASANYHTRAGAVRRWLERLGEKVSANEIERQTRLSAAWLKTAQRWNQPAFYDRARSLLQNVVEAPDAPARAFTRLGMLQQTSGNVEAAEESYRAALARDERMYVASNNLAMILIEHQKKHAEAEQIIRRVLEANPDNHAFLDTLALALAGQAKWAQAAEVWQQATDLAPQQYLYQVRLVRALLNAGEPSRARVVLNRVLEETENGLTADNAVREEIVAVQEALAERG